MKISILFLTSSYPRWEGDHAGRFLLGLVDELRKEHDVCVISPQFSESHYRPLPNGHVRFRYFYPPLLQNLAYGNGIPDNIVRNPMLLGLVIPFFMSMIRSVRHRIDSHSVLLTNWLLPCGLVGQRFRRNTKIPHISIAHGSDVHLLNVLPGGRYLARTIASGTDRIVTVACYQKEVLQKMWNGHETRIIAPPVSVLPMGFHPDPGRHSVWDQPADSPVFRVLYLGRLIRLKGVHCLIEALTGLDNLELHVAGDGPELSRLKKQAETLKIRTFFHGWINDRKKNDLLSTCHIAVFPSIISESRKQEGLPNTLLEALGWGIPVVVSTSGGMVDVIRNLQNGMIFPAADITALRQVIRYLRDNPGDCRRLSQNALASSGNYTWTRMGRQYRELVRMVYEENR
ncbi:glycosyltransferase family 4 protein [bacterium]|nr:glycosyltransferase family 4 protein [candidate division CSSED10-310 bacterium]